ncbi:MAG: hypothetical protein IKO05_04525 [Selenomonadaceae bacterium]|nr:hypothetical protein [Selenomonadaceae bacterium]
MTTEMMTMEQLDNVAGGTIAELKELVGAMQSNSFIRGFGKVCSHIPAVSEAIKYGVARDLFNMGIESDISFGFCGLGIGSKNNKYWDISNGGFKPMTHAQVLEKIKAYAA